MSTATRKQREIAEREKLILRTARAMLAKHGYLGLNMDRIAEAIEYSKGTVYQHFSSKEDLIAALCTDTLNERANMFKRAAAFNGRPRERIAAVGVADELFVALNPDHFAVENILDVGSVFGKISEERRATFLRIKASMMDTLMAVVQDAVDAGDLVLPEGVQTCEPIYGLWSQAVGHHQITSHVPLPPFDQVDLTPVLWRNYQRILDGFNWKPLSHEWDYTQTIERIRAEVFPDEHAQRHADAR